LQTQAQTLRDQLKIISTEDYQNKSIAEIDAEKEALLKQYLLIEKLINILKEKDKAIKEKMRIYSDEIEKNTSKDFCSLIDEENGNMKVIFREKIFRVWCKPYKKNKVSISLKDALLENLLRVTAQKLNYEFTDFVNKIDNEFKNLSEHYSKEYDLGEVIFKNESELKRIIIHISVFCLDSFEAFRKIIYFQNELANYDLVFKKHKSREMKEIIDLLVPDEIIFKMVKTHYDENLKIMSNAINKNFNNQLDTINDYIRFLSKAMKNIRRS
jgi:hypothetical protein